MPNYVMIILIIAVALAASAVTYFITRNRLTNDAEGKIGKADEKARQIIDEAVRTAEEKKRESLVEVKE
ncbi:MAG: DUF3552 domain-containing protein, partial [Lachnospiraceae bacterium]|nr:DUF3552 domain-containing protein [Lachnospiraceae bacterium]